MLHAIVRRHHFVLGRDNANGRCTSYETAGSTDYGLVRALVTKDQEQLAGIRKATIEFCYKIR